LKRRKFITQTSLAALALSLNIENVFANEEDYKITILHTNDWHSRIDPFPMDGGKYQGQGGAAARVALIKKIRSQEPNVLLLDAGDIFQGTPYFNFYHGEIEMKLMSEMQYDASAIGNHDFDAGLEGLAKQLVHANFPLINANYDFSNTIMNGKTIPYKIFNKGKIKIGVFGLGIEMKGLVPENLYSNTIYNNPVSIANNISSTLKHHHKCDLVICLSHLGYQYDNEKIDDIKLAQQTKNIDLIIGGHTHTFLDKPTTVSNSENKNVLINQVGWAGLVLGRIDFIFTKNKKEKAIKHSTEKISE
jgi:5'-nucleotidase